MKLLKCILVFLLLSLLSILPAGENPTEEKSGLNPDQMVARISLLQQQATGLKTQLEARDKTVSILEQELSAAQKRLKLNQDTLDVREDQLANQKALIKSKDPLIRFQEDQMAKLREVVEAQRRELKRLTQ